VVGLASFYLQNTACKECINPSQISQSLNRLVGNFPYE